MITIIETLFNRQVDTKLNNYQQRVLVTALGRLFSNLLESSVIVLLYYKMLSFFSDIFGFNDKQSEEIRSM